MVSINSSRVDIELQNKLRSYHSVLDSNLKSRYKFVDRLQFSLEDRNYMGGVSLNFIIDFNCELLGDTRISFNKLLSDMFFFKHSNIDLLEIMFNDTEKLFCIHLEQYQDKYSIVENYDSLKEKLSVEDKNENSNLQSKKKLKI